MWGSKVTNDDTWNSVLVRRAIRTLRISKNHRIWYSMVDYYSKRLTTDDPFFGLGVDLDCPAFGEYLPTVCLTLWRLETNRGNLEETGQQLAQEFQSSRKIVDKARNRMPPTFVRLSWMTPKSLPSIASSVAHAACLIPAKWATGHHQMGTDHRGYSHPLLPQSEIPTRMSAPKMNPRKERIQ